MGVITLATKDGEYHLMAGKIISFYESDESDYATEIEVEGSEDLYLTTNTCHQVLKKLEEL